MPVVPKRNRRRWGWVELDKTTTPQTWKGRWADWSQARVDAKGRSRPKQRSVVLGYKTKAGLATRGAAQARWDQIRDAVMNPSRAEAKAEWTFSDLSGGSICRSAVRCVPGGRPQQTDSNI